MVYAIYYIMYMKIPFKKFIIGMFLRNQDIEFVSKSLKMFHYHVTDDEIEKIYTEPKQDLPKKLQEKLDDRVLFKFSNKQDAKWLEQLEVAELYDYMLRREELTGDDRPPYYKWLDDCFWIHNNEDIMSMVNIFMFNEESHESISNIIQFKYKKKIGIDALKLYMRYFWDCRGVSAREALYFCMPFRKSTLIIKNIRAGEFRNLAELSKWDDDGSDVNLLFHDANYIKWKIGYIKELPIPNIKDFMNKVKTDSYYKYYEAMNMVQSVEYEEEIGNGLEGAFDSSRTKYKNVEEQKAKQAKHWMDIFVKADKAIPEDVETDEEFFTEMRTLKLEFEDEKLASIKDLKNVMDDIKGDIR